MPDLKDIPDAVRWRYAAECAATLPTLYDIAFRETLGKKYDALEQEIWMELARQVQTIVNDCSLPVRDAPEIARSVQIATIILFGPEYGGETIGLSEDGAVVIVKRCPFLSHGHTLATDYEHVFSRCMALVLSAVPLLNKNYTARFVRTMCTGDRQCEIKIEKKPEPEKKTGQADEKK
ncbi:MAG: hypothetical protein WCE46_04025 [Methanoregula sp.]|uniref:hypothetical protein n=1 Tax=Methanoregula sp. TaxID=2052170 RepID=UPI003C7094FE